MKLFIPALLASAGIAHAEPTPIAVGVNLPLGWSSADSVGASVSVGLTDHQAIRANFATHDPSFTLGLLSLAAGGEGETATSGRITDVGAGWTLYPGGLWDGFSVELGGLLRHRNTMTYDEIDSSAMTTTHTNTLGGRALVGWSLLIHQHVVISAAVGISVGHESGTETTDTDHLGMSMTTTTNVSRVDVEAEAFLRVGFAFDL